MYCKGAEKEAANLIGRGGQFYLRLKAKKGAKVAIVAVARKLPVLIWTLLTREEEYREPSRCYDTKVRKMKRLARACPVAKTSETEAALVKLLAECVFHGKTTTRVREADQDSTAKRPGLHGKPTTCTREADHHDS